MESASRFCLRGLEGMFDGNSADIDRGRRRGGLRSDRKSRALARVCSPHILVSRVVSALVIGVGNQMLDIGCANAEDERCRAPESSVLSWS